MLEPYNFYNPLLMPPPGYTGDAKRTFLAKATEYLGRCYDGVSKTHRNEVAGHVEAFCASLPADH